MRHTGRTARKPSLFYFRWLHLDFQVFVIVHNNRCVDITRRIWEEKKLMIATSKHIIHIILCTWAVEIELLLLLFYALHERWTSLPLASFTLQLFQLPFIYTRLEFWDALICCSFQSSPSGSHGTGLTLTVVSTGRWDCKLFSLGSPVNT